MLAQKRISSPLIPKIQSPTQKRIKLSDSPEFNDNQILGEENKINDAEKVNEADEKDIRDKNFKCLLKEAIKVFNGNSEIYGREHEKDFITTHIKM